MAVYRPTPACPFCGEAIAKGIYKDQSNTPPQFKIIGDTFIRWEYIPHTCAGKEKNDEKVKKEMSKLTAEFKKKGKLPPFFKQD